MARIDPKYVREYFWQTRIRKLIKWLLQIVLAVVLAFCCAYCFGQRVVVSESSMEPTFMSGDELLMNVAVYKFTSPKRGDVVVFDSGSDESKTPLIKRIIGLPGETVQIKDGLILIDGETYNEDLDLPSIVNPGTAEVPVTLDSDEYFVLGDNRNESEDSRYVDIGLITDDDIIGKLWLRYKPISGFGFV